MFEPHVFVQAAESCRLSDLANVREKDRVVFEHPINKVSHLATRYSQENPGQL